MSSYVSQEIRLKSMPQGLPDASHFELATVDVPAPAEGEIVVRNLYMSVDPYMRGRMTARDSYIPPFKLGAVMEGGAVGEVVASNAPSHAVGDHVVHMFGWREYAVAKAFNFQKIDPNLAPIQAYLGTLGMPGLTAWAGLFKVANLKDGETVFVSAASGAVGSVVCQIAKAHGCYVVGSAGSDEKCRWLTEVAGIDHAINYKTCGNLDAAVKAAFPKGIDVYFENVGGAHLEAALNHMNLFGRAAFCGLIEQYNDTTPRPGPSNLINVVGKNLRLQGFIVSHYFDQMPQFIGEAAGLIQAGKLKWQETVEHGIANAPKAFLKLFSGENAGKMLVKLA
jgi:NADPH-dependent curcumin reductase CurA